MTKEREERTVFKEREILRREEKKRQREKVKRLTYRRKK
jgi:hypothetical protein